MDELIMLRRKYELAMQTLSASSDAIFSLQAQIEAANMRIAELTPEPSIDAEAEMD